MTRRVGVCPICQQAAVLDIDHDHITGTVRGMLCARCNQGLGRLGDNITRLKAAIAYLRNPPGVPGIVYYPGQRPGHLRMKAPNNAGTIRQRLNGTWEVRITYQGKQKGFSGKTREIAIERMEAFKRQVGLLSADSA